MIGLIKKDLLMIKSNIKLLIIILMVTMLISMNGTTNITFMPAFISFMLIMSTFSYDEYNKWDAYATTFPNSRKNIIAAKYLTAIILVVFINLITIMISGLASYFNHNQNFKEIILLMTVTTIVILLLTFIVYPFIFKFGIEKGRIGFFVAIFGLTTLIAAFAQKIQLNFPETFLTFCMHYGLIIALFLLIIIGTISYQISQKIYKQKEY